MVVEYAKAGGSCPNPGVLCFVGTFSSSYLQGSVDLATPQNWAHDINSSCPTNRPVGYPSSRSGRTPSYGSGRQVPLIEATRV